MSVVARVDALLVEAKPTGRVQKVLYKMLKSLGAGVQIQWLSHDNRFSKFSLQDILDAAEHLASKGLAKFDGDILAPA